MEVNATDEVFRAQENNLIHIAPLSGESIKNKITINGYSQEPTNFILSDSLGKQIKKFTIDSDGIFSKRIDLSYLKEGVYLLKIVNSEEEIVKKLIKL